MNSGFLDLEMLVAFTFFLKRNLKLKELYFKWCF